MATQYQVFGNTGNGGPIDYSTVLATVSGLSWQPPALQPGSDWSFGVRAVDAATGAAEGNVDARVRITLDANGNDIGALPAAPTILDCQAVGGGSLRLDWSWFDARYPAATFLIFTSGTAVGPPLATVPPLRTRIAGKVVTPPSGTTTLGVQAVVQGVGSALATVVVPATQPPPKPPASLTATTTDQPPP